MNSEIIKLCREYLEKSATGGEYRNIRKKLDGFDGDPDELAAGLFARNYSNNVKRGYLPDMKFSVPSAKKRFSTGRMWNFVPHTYDASKPHGVMIFLHGGGKGVENTSPKKYWESIKIADIFKNSGRIVCLPSAPPDTGSFARWHLPEVDDYLLCVIDELRMKYNIDDNNIILAGTSMGGMGVNSVAQRLNDRFASFLSSSSQWDIANWHSLKNVDFWILQGVNDATMYKRRHGTDIEFARLMKTRLEQAGAALHYREHCGRHSLVNGRHIFKEWLDYCNNIARTPYAMKHVVAVSPRGCTPYSDFRRYPLPKPAEQTADTFNLLSEAPHSHWLTIGEIANESIIYDMAVMSGVGDLAESTWNDFELKIKRKHIRGGLVEAAICDRGTIEITPVNVKKFSVYLHPEMVDFDNLTVYVLGEKRFSGKLVPSLSVMLESYLRRRDPKALYHARLDFTDEKEQWLTKDQLGGAK